MKILCAGCAVAAFIVGAAVGAAVFFFLIDTKESVTCQRPSVLIESGLLRGTCRRGLHGRAPYAAFLGVPYARPPTGKLRFKAPRPVEAWDGERDATLFSQVCRQGKPDKQQLGNEDCLYANVYVPWPLRRHAALAVLVKVHGGANTEQSSNILRPDYYVDGGIVVVTFNYRLNHFGFLSLDNDAAPGNAGLKDMVAALQWVHRNIGFFGGDPDRVTVQGCSSAAGTVHWLTLLPATAGLFRAAIIMSGSGMAPWSYAENHRDVSRLALDKLRSLHPFSTDKELLEELDPHTLALAFAFADKNRNKSRPEDRKGSPWEPRLVAADAEAYLLGSPAPRPRVPLLMGFVECEYSMLANYILVMEEMVPLRVDAENADPRLLAVTPRSVIPARSAQRALGLSNYSHSYEELEADIRTGFFNSGRASCDERCHWEAFFSETLVKIETVRALRMEARRGNAPVYAYRYDFPAEGDCPTHGIDHKITWPSSEEAIVKLTTTDTYALNILRLVTFHTNFVKTGKPVLETDPVVLTTNWAPTNKEGPDKFMKIGYDLTLEEGDMLGDNGPFWRNLYLKYRDNTGM